MGHDLEMQGSEAGTRTLQGAGGFAASAEFERRAGRLSEAEQGLRAGLEGEPGSVEGRIVLALVLLDRGLERAAHSELERLAEQVLAEFGIGEASGPVSEAEIDAAMQRAVHEERVESDPHGVAISVARRFSPSLEAGAGEAAASPGMLRGAFQTRTMAEVLERQGDNRGAAHIREHLASRHSLGVTSPRARVGGAGARAELERWLENLRTRKDVTP